MIGTHFIRIARELSVFVVPGALFYPILGAANKHKKAEVLQDGKIEFATSILLVIVMSTLPDDVTKEQVLAAMQTGLQRQMVTSS